MEEKWVPVKVWKNGQLFDFTGYYEVNTQGIIKTVERYVKHNFGGLKICRAHEVKLTLVSTGYIRVSLYKENKQLNCAVQRIVYESFNGPIPEGMQVNHINEDKTDNRLENLNLMTPKENSNWGTRTERTAEKLAVPIKQYTKDGVLIKNWAGAKFVEKAIPDFSSKNIQKCCAGKIQSAYGYIWRYA